MRAIPLASVAALAVAAASFAAAPPVTDIEQAGAKKMSIQGDWLTAGVGAIWLSNPPRAVIYRLDPRSGATTATVRVPQVPCEATDVAFGSVWTATCKVPGLARIDPVAHKISGFVRLKIPLGLDGEGSVGAGVGGVWLVVDGPKCFACRVARVDPKTLRVIAEIPVRDSSAAVRVGYGAVWVTNPQENLVEKIAPATNRVVATIKVGAGPRFFAVGERGVWTLNQRTGTVTRISPATGKVVATIRAGVVGDGGDLTTGGGWVWARGTDTLLVRIDPRTNAIAARYGPSSGSGAAIVGFGAAWISAHDISTVWRLPLPKP